MKQSLFYLNDDDRWFPPVKDALSDPPGLLAIGGDLSVRRLTHAYQQGIFPWYSDNEPLLWWSPDPRAIIDLNALRINKSLRKFIKKCQYTVTLNTAFRSVVELCAKPRSDENGTWIFPEMVDAYCELNDAGTAYSIEVWDDSNGDNQLIGGLYGVKVGSCFCGESMFSKQPNASKIALIALSSLLKKFEYGFIDCQLPNPYLLSMGAKTVPRTMFIERLNLSKNEKVDNDPFMSLDSHLTKEINWREGVLP